ncbi:MULTISPECIES: L-fucose/L-arabinose isomerase family protein [Vibrio]|uniref:L-fucose/L-arabinose isomerase family protein n=1 Tax=Vibrio TaxID=662 RepID=UPI000243C0DD|nr:MULTISPECIES: L-fucose isomerase-like protein [Vibrio]AEX22349.1 L-fucose isomerase-like protein [Vibrio sp. EJY3]
MIKSEISLEGVATDFIASLIPAEKPRKKTRIAFVSVAIEIHFNWDLARETTLSVAESIRQMLPEEQYDFIAAQEPFQDHTELQQFLDDAAHGGIDGLVLCHSAYTTGEVASQLGTWLSRHKTPIFSLAMPEPMGNGLNLQANRLCSQNFVLGILNSLDVKYQWLFCAPQDERVEAELQRFARVSRTLSQLKGRKALIAGASRVPGFYDCEVNELEIMKKLELGFDRVNLVDITSRMSEFKDDDVQEVKRLILSHPDCKLNNVPDKQVEDTIRLALALMVVAREGDYLGVSFKNWPELFDHLNVAGDGAMALMNDQGIIVADEADTGAMITMLLFKELRHGLSQPMLSDISYLSSDGERLGVWHNGSAATCLRKQAAGFECRKHGILENYDEETAWGMLFEFLVEPGPVTIAKYQAPSIDTVLAFEGEIVESDMKFRGTYGEVIPSGVSAAQVVGTILDKGLDHHWIVGRGHFAEDLKVLNYWLGVEDIPVSNAGESAGFGGQ